MNNVVAPLKPFNKGLEVANLQGALQFLIERGRLALDPATRDAFQKAFDAERGKQIFGDKATSVLVRLFQAQAHLPVSGEVDAATADALNSALRDLGALDSDPPPGQFLVHGQITYASGKNASGVDGSSL